MAGALDRKAVSSTLLSYEGPFGVGYGVAVFEVTGEDGARDFGRQLEAAERSRFERRKAAEDPYVRLARLSLETYLATGRTAALPDGLPAEMTERAAGAFVSLKKDGLLRGCIGTIAPTQSSVAAEILQNAISAGVRDPRFEPVTKAELPQLTFSVDVLGEPEPIESEAQLDVKRYGVIVERGRRRGLLLPDLEGVDTPAQQIDIARQKAGIAPDETVRLWRFEVVRHV
jgi:AmmeMemoRadiSam system protein A